MAQPCSLQRRVMNSKIAVPALAFESYRAELLHLAELLRAGTCTPLPHDRVLARRLALAFEQGVAQFHPYPDDDPRWRSTFAAWLERSGPEAFIQHLCTRRFQACPDHDVARWFVIATNVYFGSNDFAADLLSALVVREATNLRWLIASAVWVYALSGVETSIWLREELFFLQDVVPGVLDLLRELRDADDQHTTWTAEIGMAVYNGARFHSMGAPGSSWCAFPPR